MEQKSDIYLAKKIVEKLKKKEHSYFLNKREIKLVISFLNKEKIKYNIFLPYKESELAILYADNMPSISLLEIKSNERFRHQDILGSIYSLSLNVNIFGGIIKKEKDYIIVIDTMKNYVIDNLIKIGNNFISLKEVDTNLLEDYEISFEETLISVVSNRIDVVISRLINCSRSQLLEKIKNKEVILNDNILTNNSYLLKENDAFSIKKYGKYCYINIINTTKNNKNIIKIKKYI